MGIKEFDNFFDTETTSKKRKEIMDRFIQEYKATCFHKSLPKEFYPILHKILTYRIGHTRSEYKLEDIRTFMIIKDAYGHDAIGFYDVNGNFEPLGLIGCLKAIARQHNAIWEEKKTAVLSVLRWLAKPQVDSFLNSVVFPAKSGLSDTMIYSRDDAHVDHFDDDLAKCQFDWMLGLKDYYEAKYSKLCDMISLLWKHIDKSSSKWTKFADDGLNNSYQKYLAGHTHLRLVTKKENLARAKETQNWDLLKLNGKYKRK